MAATVTVNRPDILGISNTAKIYAAGSENSLAGATALPANSIASGTTDSAGSLTITDAALSSLTRYVVAAVVGGVVQWVRCRSTLDVEDRGTATGTVDTTSGSANLANVTASAGAFAHGQTITGPGIPAQTTLISGSGNAWVMSTAATANASGVAVAAYGARVPATGLGATTVPQTPGTTWAARVRQRRVALSTS